MVCEVPEIIMFVTLRREEGEEQMSGVIEDVIEQCQISRDYV